ncbi:hypothetical protein ACFX1Q_000461 [Malus domestica]
MPVSCRNNTLTENGNNGIGRRGRRLQRLSCSSPPSIPIPRSTDKIGPSQTTIGATSSLIARAKSMPKSCSPIEMGQSRISVLAGPNSTENRLNFIANGMDLKFDVV